MIISIIRQDDLAPGAQRRPTLPLRRDHPGGNTSVKFDLIV